VSPAINSECRSALKDGATSKSLLIGVVSGLEYRRSLRVGKKFCRNTLPLGSFLRLTSLGKLSK
jgi:hypothetical protein